MWTPPRAMDRTRQRGPAFVGASLTSGTGSLEGTESSAFGGSAPNIASAAWMTVQDENTATKARTLRPQADQGGLERGLFVSASPCDPPPWRDGSLPGDSSRVHTIVSLDAAGMVNQSTQFTVSSANPPASNGRAPMP